MVNTKRLRIGRASWSESCNRNIIDLSLKPGERRCSLEFGVSVAVRFRDGVCSMTGMSVVATRQPFANAYTSFLLLSPSRLCPMLTSAPSPQKEDEKVMLCAIVTVVMPALIGTSLELGMRSCFPRHLAPQVSRTTMATPSSFPPSRAVRGDLVRFPGVTIDSTQAVRRLLTENNRRFHIYQKISCEAIALQKVTDAI